MSAHEKAEMRALLRAHGYPEKYATTLGAEGMGPYELEGRLRKRPGAVGSLEYTHGFQRSALTRKRRHRAKGKHRPSARGGVVTK